MSDRARALAARVCPLLAALVAALLLPGRAAAQTITPEPPGPYVIDLRGAMVGVPQAATFYPAVPSGTVVPARGFGGEIGVHVYPLRVGRSRLGLGVSFTEVRGTATTATAAATTSSSSSSSSSSVSSSSSPSGSTLPVVFPDVRAWERFIAPEVSFNFGTHDGWSYLSGGYGTVRNKTETVTPARTDTATETQGAAHIGGGARWFLREHVAVGFDVRFYRIPGATMVGVSAGFSVR